MGDFQVRIACGGAGVRLPDEIKLRGTSNSYQIFIRIIDRWPSVRPSQSNCCNGLRPTQLPVVILALLQLEVFKSNWFYHERFLLHLPHSVSVEVGRDFPTACSTKIPGLESDFAVAALPLSPRQLNSVYQT